MAHNDGLTELILGALKHDPVTVTELNQHTKDVLSRLASQADLSRDQDDGCAGCAVVTFRSQPQFLLVPIADRSEYHHAVATRALEQAAAMGLGKPEPAGDLEIVASDGDEPAFLPS